MAGPVRRNRAFSFFPSHPARPAGVGVVAALVRCLVVLGCLAGPSAHAQGWGLFGGLFGQQPQVQAPPVYRRLYAPRRRVVAPRPHDTLKEAETPAAPKTPPVDASHFVVVMGDSLGQLLANGLDEAFVDRPDVAVVHKARDSTGMVREDFYDWPKAVAALLANAETRPAAPKTDAGPEGPNKAAPDRPGADKPASKDRIDVAVMMIGSNDRQSITEGGKTYALGTDEWTAIYTRRVTAIAEAFKKKAVPLVWVGVPITKGDAFADDMAALNEVYRDVAAKTGATYVDTWEAFSDDNGDFSAFGPDINGQTVRLRAADGIHFTKAGARKLAHFVEAHIRRDLDALKPALPATAALPSSDEGKQGDPGKTGDPKKGAAVAPAIAKPDAGPVRVLTDLPSAENGRLAGPPAPSSVPHDDPLVETTLVKGEALGAHPGRADDASWPPH